MNTLLKYLKNNVKFHRLSKLHHSPQQKIELKNVSDSLASLLVYYTFMVMNDNLLVIAPNLYHAQKFYDKLVQVMGDTHVHFFPMDEFISVEMLASSDEFRQERINTIVELINNQKGIVVTHSIGAIRKLPPKRVFNDHIIKIDLQSEIELNDLLKKLIMLGYKRVEVVENLGEFALRGGIIDIFPYTSDHPYRIELFDIEVDSIRVFDVKTQRTIEMVDQILITPIYELIYDEDTKLKTIEKLKNQFTHAHGDKKVTILGQLEEQFTEELLKIENNADLGRLHKYIDYFYPDSATVLDYLVNPAIFYLDYSSVQNSFNQFKIEFHQYLTELLENNKLPIITNHYIDLNDLLDQSAKQYFVQDYNLLSKDVSLEVKIDFESREIEKYYGKYDELYIELKRQYGLKTYLICLHNKSSLQHFSELLTEANISHLVIGERDEVQPMAINLLVSQVSEGFELVHEAIKVITPAELYAKSSKVVKYRSSRVKDGKALKDLNELKIGDYVVHVDHGIGQYLGIETLTTNGTQRDFLKIAYQGEDKLYVPVENINLIKKYKGNEGVRPKIHKLGGKEWAKAKQRVRTAVKDIANKLIKLYAEREKAIGFAFSPDTEMQLEFEAAFSYKETPDQLEATREVKADMEKPVPMDRLLCGDVGYGKTEVAMRAAFKAVMDNKQVAYLAPTTILTQQHYQTFTERFRDYPINIALLNRFVSEKEQNDIIKKLKKGQIDIVIGTHRLLSDDVSFHDLGLLIVDEEQRFGVEHKEKIKEMKVNVDVLTLTATPIPRTLQMSLVGVRSLSLLETPPENRYPVQTYVVEENDAIIKEAIERELSRKGQVFFLHNRIEDIDQRVSKIMRLVPDARVISAHGQMPKDQLEKTMLGFLNREYDVLVCTTIIETGIDIASANTLLIANADRFGLSQLYQLRGRVGRSDRIAYAYMMYPKQKQLSEVAVKRLKAIKDFTELGSGFKIAKQDLAIRGAGDLLGAEQHGFIDTVGFELYNEMLKEAIEENRQDTTLRDTYLPSGDNVEIRVLVDAYIPSSYIQEEAIKIEIYKKVKLLNSIQDLQDLEDELIDRFGEFPEPVRNLLNLAYIRSVSMDLGITKITETKTSVEFLFSHEASEKVPGEKYFMAATEISRNINFRYYKKQLMIFISKPRLKENYLDIMRAFFVKISQVD